MNAVSRFIRARLSRVIFAWFAVTILLTTAVVAGAIATYVLAGGQSHWQLRIERAERFVSNQVAHVWDNPNERRRFLDAVGADLGVQIELYRADQSLLDRAGPEVCDARVHMIPVYRNGKERGTARLCDPEARGATGLVLALLLIAFVIWAASGFAAGRIARPLRKLTQAATEFGSGDLSARAPSIADESELAELSRAFNDMANQIGSQIENHQTLLAEVSHELRTPLGHLRLLVELLRAENGESRHLVGLEAEVQTLDILVDQLLAKSRLEFEMDRAESLSASAIAVSACESVGVDVSRLAVQVDANVRGDAMLLRSALTNILRNALIHGDGVSSFTVSADDVFVSFAVEDRGNGDPQELQALTAPFQRGETDSQGLGLGLSLVQRIANAHGGELTFLDGDHGARVVLKVPRVET